MNITKPNSTKIFIQKFIPIIPNNYEILFKEEESFFDHEEVLKISNDNNIILEFFITYDFLRVVIKDKLNDNYVKCYEKFHLYEFLILIKKIFKLYETEETKKLINSKRVINKFKL